MCAPAERGTTPARRASAPGWLLIGARSDRHGANELACSLIGHFGRNRPLAAVRVSIVGENPDEDPPAAAGQALAARGFHLTEESGISSLAPVTRMRRAGARSAIQLWAHASALVDGFGAARAMLGAGAMVVVDSHSLRRVSDPDLFLMIDARGGGPPDLSAQEVVDFVDRWVVADDGCFDLQLDALTIEDGRWMLEEPATAIVLAGGRSRRMGADKRFLPLVEGTLLERVVAALQPLVGEVVIGANDPELGRTLGLRTVPDRVPGEGPLMALSSSLAATTSDRNLLVACDLPDIPPALVRALLDAALSAEAVIPVDAQGLPEPLLAVYRRRLLPDAERLLASGERSLRSLFESRRTTYVELARFGLDRLPNLNTREDYERYLRSRGQAR